MIPYEEDSNFELESHQNFSPEYEKQMGTDVLQVESNDITKQIIDEKDSNKLQDLTDLFNINQKKKNIARANKLSNLLNLVDNEMIYRVSLHPEEIKDENLIRYLTSAQNSMNSINQAMNETPIIQINQQNNEINLGNDPSGLNQEERKRVLEVVSQILNNTKKDNSDFKEIIDET